MKRALRILMITGALVLSMASTAAAGMITVVTFDEVPAEFQAGTTHTLGYSILAHGKSPIEAGPTCCSFSRPGRGDADLRGYVRWKGSLQGRSSHPELRSMEMGGDHGHLRETATRQRDGGR